VLSLRKNSSRQDGSWKHPRAALVVTHPGFLAPPHLHAELARLQQDDHPTRARRAHEGFGDLLGQPLLELRTARVMFEESPHASETEQRAIGHVADVGLPEEGQQMMRAHGVKRHIRHHDHLPLAPLSRERHDLRLLLAIGVAEEVHIPLGHPLGRVPQFRIARRIQTQQP
jgi:hypothetical protein